MKLIPGSATILRLGQSRQFWPALPRYRTSASTVADFAGIAYVSAFWLESRIQAANTNPPSKRTEIRMDAAAMFLAGQEWPVGSNTEPRWRMDNDLVMA